MKSYFNKKVILDCIISSTFDTPGRQCIFPMALKGYSVSGWMI